MTPEEFKAARHELGLSANEMAKALGLSDGRSVRRFESGERDISGPVVVLVGVMLYQHRKSAKRKT